jgi:hypothetical protein
MRRLAQSAAVRVSAEPPRPLFRACLEVTVASSARTSASAAGVMARAQVVAPWRLADKHHGELGIRCGLPDSHRLRWLPEISR